MAKELLNYVEEAIDKLDREVGNSISKMQEQSNEAPLVSANCATDTLKGTISFRIPQVVKGAKKKRGTTPLENKKGKKKKKNAKDKGEGAGPDQATDINAENIGVNRMVPHFANDVSGQSSTMVVPLIREEYVNASMPQFNIYPASVTPYIGGGYTSLLLGVDQAATWQLPARRLEFDGPPSQGNMQA